VRFDGLTRGEIFGRLFGLFYGPSFVIFVLTRFARLFPAEPWSSIAAALGFVLVFVTIGYDALTAKLPVVRWALIGSLPFLGWWLYARVRGPAVAAEPPLDSPGRVLALVNIFSSRRYRLSTPLGLEECVARLRRRSASRWSPLTWFARSAERPLLGRVSQKGFALKVRHVLTRPTMLDEARGRFSADATGTAIDVRIGVSMFDRVFACSWIGLALLGSLIFLSVPESSWRPAPPPRALLILLPFGATAFFLVVLALVRAIGRADRARLYDVIRTELEANEVGSLAPSH